MDRALVILNPAAGRGFPSRTKRLIEDACERAGWTPVVVQTERGRSIVDDVTENLERGVEHVIAAGGDGTVAAVATALIGSDVPLGIVPIGTGNVLARELGIPVSAERAVRLIVEREQICELDAMQIMDRAYFLNASIGFSSLVVDSTDRLEKQFMGRTAYVWNGWLNLFGLQRYRFAIDIDGIHQRVRASEVLVLNTAGLGEPIVRVPDVLPDDGKLCVCIIRARNLVDWFLLGADFLMGKRDSARHITLEPAYESIHVVADSPLPTQADGEVLGNSEIDLRLVPRAVRVIVPANRSEPSLRLPRMVMGGQSR